MLRKRVTKYHVILEVSGVLLKTRLPVLRGIFILILHVKINYSTIVIICTLIDLVSISKSLSKLSRKLIYSFVVGHKKV